MKALVACIAVSLSAVATASDNSVSAQDALKQHLSTMQQYRAAFSQRVSDADGNVVHEATGTLTLARPDKLRWETVTPDASLLIADGQSVWNIDPFVEQVTVIAQDKAVSDNPIILLTTSDPAVWDTFTISYGEDQSSFSVVPLAQGGQIQSLSLTFDSNTLVALSMVDSQSQLSALSFSDIATTFDISTGYFSPEIPDTYIVDDQR
ncbi:outer membrane lipoprotein chaperone LolA [Alteromonas sp. CYL-A6]|uniref:outer membrane lipoprotein chaperone LolA n=1 Tax=Alteromonas nitratireducens TaxID=3390813 RepID=UPI0034C31C55